MKKITARPKKIVAMKNAAKKRYKRRQASKGKKKNPDLYKWQLEALTRKREKLEATQKEAEKKIKEREKAAKKVAKKRVKAEKK